MFLVSKEIWGEWIYACKACCIIKTKTSSIVFNNAACFRFNNAACRFSTCKITPEFSLPPKNTAPVFLTQLVCIIFLSAFGDIMQTENNGFGWRSVIFFSFPSGSLSTARAFSCAYISQLFSACPIHYTWRQIFNFSFNLQNRSRRFVFRWCPFFLRSHDC